MKAYETDIVIEVTPKWVWSILVDGTRWTEWNPTVNKVDGTIAAGNQIKVFVKLSPGQAVPLTVSKFSPPLRMVWSGGMPFELFKGIRTYTLDATISGTRFSMREKFTGPLTALITRSIPDMQPAFDEFTASLKRRAESDAATPTEGDA